VSISDHFNSDQDLILSTNDFSKDCLYSVYNGSNFNVIASIETKKQVDQRSRGSSNTSSFRVPVKSFSAPPKYRDTITYDSSVYIVERVTDETNLTYTFDARRNESGKLN